MALLRQILFTKSFLFCLVVPAAASPAGVDRAIAADTLTIGGTYAKSVLVFATRADTPIDSVTPDWVARAYSGAVTQWPNGKPVQLVLRPEHELYAFSPAMKQAMVAAQERPGLLIEDAAQDATNRLMQLEGSLGTAALAQIKSERHTLKPLSFDGVAPSTKTLVSGHYPLVNEFLYVTRRDARTVARDFIAFLKSDEAAGILKKTGNVVAPRTERLTSCTKAHS
jgi:phosphate transport system substrate-binding protein